MQCTNFCNRKKYREKGDLKPYPSYNLGFKSLIQPGKGWILRNTSWKTECLNYIGKWVIKLNYELHGDTWKALTIYYF
jgi:hypothetical protein